MTSDPHVDGASGELIVLDQRAARASGEHRSRQTRGLSTANAVLKVLAFMTQHPEGVSARQVADELGKSVSTAYYLLASLLEEGFADHQQGRLYRLRADAPLGPARPHPAPDDALLHAADDLFDRTHRRTYIGCVQAGAIVTTATRGRQGIPRIRGLGTRIGRNAHALAIGKVVLSLLSDRGRRRDVDGGLPSYTTRTITSAEVLLADPEVVERDCEPQGVSGGEFVGQCGGDGRRLRAVRGCDPPLACVVRTPPSPTRWMAAGQSRFTEHAELIDRLARTVEKAIATDTHDTEAESPVATAG